MCYGHLPDQDVSGYFCRTVFSSFLPIIEPSVIFRTPKALQVVLYPCPDPFLTTKCYYQDSLDLMFGFLS